MDDKTINADADRAMIKRFLAFAETIAPGDREAYFHPINRSNWQNDFACWLLEKSRGFQ